MKAQTHGLGGRGSLQADLCAVLLLTLGALVVDYLLAPSLYNGSTLWATGALFVLILRQKKEGANPQELNAAVVLLERGWRLPFFVLFHITFVIIGRGLASRLHAASLTYTVSAAAMASTKLLVLAPTFFILSLATWRHVARTFRFEVVASLVVFFTFFPHRVFEALWPCYSQLLGRVVCSVTTLFVSHLVCSGGTTPTFLGPKLDISIIFACSGFDSLRLFQVLFGFVVGVEWRWLNKSRTLIVYFVGLATTLMANALRISLLVILGNRGLKESVMRHHVNAGWAVFLVTFLVFLSFTYNWMQRHGEVACRRTQLSSRVYQQQF